MWKAQLRKSVEAKLIPLQGDSLSEADLSTLVFPYSNAEFVAARVEALRKLGVDGLFMTYDEQANVWYPCLLGKGSRGVVVLCSFKGVRAAVKLRRMDSPVNTLKKEAENHLIANKTGVGPRLYSYSDEAIVMEYLEGPTLEKWLSEEPEAEKVKTLLVTVFSKCFKLDKAQLSHNQLSDASTHVIVKKGPEGEIIDFSHSSISRKPNNLPQLASYVINRIARDNSGDSRDKLFKLLRRYKQSYSDEVFRDVVCLLLDIVDG